MEFGEQEGEGRGESTPGRGAAENTCRQKGRAGSGGGKRRGRRGQREGEEGGKRRGRVKEEEPECEEKMLLGGVTAGETVTGECTWERREHVRRCVALSFR